MSGTGDDRLFTSSERESIGFADIGVGAKGQNTGGDNGRVEIRSGKNGAVLLRILEDKGYVGHKTEGRAHRYEPLVERSDAGGSALKRVRNRLFEGSAELMLTRLVDDNGIPEEELRRMRDLLARRLGEDES